MKILFLCGSLEPGRDGVGDYVRRLSAELIRQGHVIAAAAINDRHITEVYEDTGKSEGGVAILRVPANLKDEQRFPLVKVFADAFNPDWLSLQFVSFSFHPKGLVFGLSKKLAMLGKGRPWHIMFHELWVGMTDQSSKKELVWGMMQRQLIKNLISKLQPGVIHTHTDLYKKQLEKMGAKAVLLPLFSNIPVCCPDKVTEKINAGIKIADHVNIMIFGGIHGGAPIKELVKEAENYAEKYQLVLELTILGRSGAAQENWVNEWSGPRLKVTQLGEQSAEKVSGFLGASALGIFTTPIALVEKSGSVAAMREHGIHLLCVSQPWDPRNIMIGNNPYGIMNYSKGNLETFFKSKPDFSYMPVLSTVSRQFISNLMNNK
jgi:hypothetical protein